LKKELGFEIKWATKKKGPKYRK